MKRAFIRKSDFIVIIVILAAAGSFWLYGRFFARQGRKAVIYLDGAVIREIELMAVSNGSFSLPEVPQIVFTVKDKKVSFTESDCPDKVCIRAGYIFRNRESAACLPNKCVIIIANDEDAPSVSP